MKASFGKVCESTGQAVGKLCKHWTSFRKVCEGIGQALGKFVKSLDKTSFGKVCEISGSLRKHWTSFFGKFVKHWTSFGKVSEIIRQAFGNFVKALDKLSEALDKLWESL